MTGYMPRMTSSQLYDRILVKGAVGSLNNFQREDGHRCLIFQEAIQPSRPFILNNAAYCVTVSIIAFRIPDWSSVSGIHENSRVGSREGWKGS